MKLSDYERIEKVKKYLNINFDTVFCRKIGIKNSQLLSEIKRGKISISPNLANKIVAYVPSVSYEWLMTGNGEMLRAGASNIVTAQGDNKGATIAGGNVTTAAGDSDRLLAIIESQQATIASQQQSSSELVLMLKKLTEKIVATMPTVVAVVALASSLALTGCKKEVKCEWEDLKLKGAEDDFSPVEGASNFQLNVLHRYVCDDGSVRAEFSTFNGDTIWF